MSDAEISREQFRSQFQLHEPQLLSLLDGLINEMGRGPGMELKLFCPLDAYESNDARYKNKETW